MSLDAKRNENILYMGGSAIFPFYVAPFDDVYFNSKLISGSNDSGIEVYFELELTSILQEYPILLDPVFIDKIKNTIHAKLAIGPLVAYYDSNTYSDVASACMIDLEKNTPNTFTYTALNDALSQHLAQSSSGGVSDLGNARVCFYLDTSAYLTILNEDASVDLGAGSTLLNSFLYDVKINNLYMQKLVIPYLEPPKIELSSTKSYINDKVLNMDTTVEVKDKLGNIKTGSDFTFTDNYGASHTMKGYKFAPYARDVNDPLVEYLSSSEGPHNLRSMMPEGSVPVGCSLGMFKLTANKFIENINMFFIDFEYIDSATNYGLTPIPVSLKGTRPGNSFCGMVAVAKKSDLLAAGLLQSELDTYTDHFFNLKHADGTAEDAYWLIKEYASSGTSGVLRYHDDQYLSILDRVFKKIGDDDTFDVYVIPYLVYWNTYIATRTGPNQWQTYFYTPSADAVNIMNLTFGIQISNSTEGAFKIADKMDTIFELSDIKEVGYLQVGAGLSFGQDGEYACYRIFASKDGKVWDYLGDSIGLDKTIESTDAYQYLSIDISNIAEPDATKTYSKIKGKVLKVSIPDNNMYLRNATTGIANVIDGSKEFAIRDIVINNAGTILDFALSGLTKLTYKGEVFNGAAADTRFTQLLKDTDFINIDFTDLKAEGSELLIDLGSEKEFDTVNIITGKTVTEGIQEMKYSITISTDGVTFKDVISMDPATFTPEMFLKRTGMLVLNSNCFFTDDVGTNTPTVPNIPS